jgi:hypothetical protein
MHKTFQFAFGDLVAVGVPKENRSWKFDIRNKLGIYMGQVEGSVYTHRVYSPFNHKVYDRGSVHRIEIEESQLLKWYITQYNYHQQRLPFNTVQDAVYSFFVNDSDHSNRTLDDPLIVQLSVPLIGEHGTLSSGKGGQEVSESSTSSIARENVSSLREP